MRILAKLSQRAGKGWSSHVSRRRHVHQKANPDASIENKSIVTK